MNKRCVNCGINLDSLYFSDLTSVQKHLLQKLEDWVEHNIIATNHANVFICVACLLNLEVQKERILPSRNICLGCGVSVSKDSVLLTGEKLQICRSWARDIAVDHLNKVCPPCYRRLAYSSTKTYKSEDDMKEILFVGIPADEPEKDDPEGTINVKSEPENSDNDEDNCLKKDNLEDNTALKEENDLNDSEKDVLSINNDALNVEDGNDDNHSDEEVVSLSSIKSEAEGTDYEYLEEFPGDSEGLESNKLEACQTVGYRREMDDDDDYVPPASMKKTVRKAIVKSTNICSEGIMAVELESYKRTTRIGHCVFNNCSKDSVSLIPRTIRRKMVIEHNTYIPMLSKVCEEHSQDQNWEDLTVEVTTNLFRAEHCQDMVNIVSEVSRTNFDFENIETVDSKLVRYWFDVNKAEFNRIFGYFPKLKWLKEPKTAFAIYLMHLQKTRVKRIALLLKMRQNAVKSRIVFVRNVVKCCTYKELKEKFLDDD